LTATAGALLDELGRRHALADKPFATQPARWDEFFVSLLPQQQALCRTAARWVASPTPRRGGKSTTGQGLLLDGGHRNPQTVVYYVHPGGGKRAIETLMGPDINLLRTCERYGLPWRWNANLRTLFHRELGTEIRLRGADDKVEAQKMRGDKVSRVVIDEAQNFPPDLLRQLVEKDLGPALLDCEGQIYLLGTVGELCRPGDLWYDVTRNETPESLAARDQTWEVHEWLALDNPYVGRQVAREISTKLAALGGGDKAELERRLRDPVPAEREALVQLALTLSAYTVVREHFGRWVQDTQGQVYHYLPARNTYVTLPRGHTWLYVLGGDLGTSDSYAHTVLAVASTHPVVYEVESHKERNLNSDQWRERFEDARKRWNPVRCCLDEGGLGKGIGDAWRAAGIPVESAQKAEKLAAIALLNGALEAGRVKVLAEGELAREWVALRRAQKARPGVYEVVNDDHVADAKLYAWRIASTLAGEVDAPAKDETAAERSERLAIEALMKANADQQALTDRLTRWGVNSKSVNRGR